MIIANLETFPLRIPFRSSTGAAASVRGDKDSPASDSLLVRLTTNEGPEGWGETFGFPAVCSAKLATEELIASLCVSRDATQISPLMLEVQKKTAHLRAKRASFLWYFGGGHCPLGYSRQHYRAPVYFDLEAQLYGGMLTPVNGRISVSRGPGLGLDPDRNVIRDYLKVGTDNGTQKVA